MVLTDWLVLESLSQRHIKAVSGNKQTGIKYWYWNPAGWNVTNKKGKQNGKQQVPSLPAAFHPPSSVPIGGANRDTAGKGQILCAKS